VIVFHRFAAAIRGPTVEFFAQAFLGFWFGHEPIVTLTLDNS
jgi:hypothetical protein